MRESARGFTVLEVLVSGALIALVMGILFTLYPSSLLAVNRGEHVVEASSLAQSALERYRALPFSRLRSMAPSVGGVPEPVEIAGLPTGPDGTVYTPILTVFRIPGQDSDPVRVLGLRVVVSWRERDQTRELQQEVWVCEIKR